MYLFDVSLPMNLIVMTVLHVNSIPCDGPYLVIKYIILSYLLLLTVVLGEVVIPLNRFKPPVIVHSTDRGSGRGWNPVKPFKPPVKVHITDRGSGRGWDPIKPV